MSHADDWNPDDGPPPSDDERASARALSEALDHREAPRDPDLAAALSVARRVQATAHPDPEAARKVADRVVSAALAEHARPAWRRALRGRWGLAAVAAAGLLAVGVGAGVSATRPAPRPVDPITATTAGDFTERLGENVGSAPAARIYDDRMRAYRDRLLRGGRR
ncbi:MAG: hypothetical protein R3A52_09265 [Polyangiales bacterium]